MGRQIGYARVSTDDLHGKAQKAALHAVPCELLFFEQESGANRDRAATVSQATGVIWTVERLTRSVRRLVGEGMVDHKVLGKAPRPRRRRSEELAVLVQGLALTNPGLSLRGIGSQLEAMKIRTPAGKPTWTAASVAHLMNKVPGAPST